MLTEPEDNLCFAHSPPVEGAVSLPDLLTPLIESPSGLTLSRGKLDLEKVSP